MNRSLTKKETLTWIFIICGLLCFPLPTSARKGPLTEYVIGTGDVLDIQVWDHDDLHRTVEILQNGEFSFPLIGKVDANGLSVFELEKRIRTRLADGYIVGPQVTVNVSAYKNMRVFIFGEVNKPGSYVLKKKSRLLEVISKADGFTPEAGPTISIVRAKRASAGDHSQPVKNDSETMTIDLDDLKAGRHDKSFLVMSGDTIHVGKAPDIFITGAVNRPGRYKWGKGLTVRQAISLAGGLTDRAAPKRTKIAHSDAKNEKPLKADFNGNVMPGDTIMVPESFF